ncbi:hypothetical protein MMC06_006828 [Schaereria dolodes]|nr:hypothetical protein [Schaereria dolodes]
MSDEQVLPLDLRYMKRVVDEFEQRESEIEAERAARQHEVFELARGALSPSRESTRHLPGVQTPQSPQRVNRSSSRIIEELDSRSLPPQRSQPATLPTPPASPVVSKTPIKASSAALLASTTESQETANFRAALQEHQSQIRRLTLKLEDTQSEVQSLRNERREASKEYMRAVRAGVEEQIDKFKKREERLVRIVEEKEQVIEGLENRIDEGRIRERELRLRVMEAERGGYDGEREGAEGTGKQNSNQTVEKQAGARAVKKSWEFRRRKGERTTPLSVATQLVLKGRTL